MCLCMYLCVHVPTTETIFKVQNFLGWFPFLNKFLRMAIFVVFDNNRTYTVIESTENCFLVVFLLSTFCFDFFYS